MALTPEDVLASLVAEIAKSAFNGIATFDMCYDRIPQMITLTPEDLAPSGPRNGEPLWKQRVRNIKSHDDSPNNYIELGILEHVPGVGFKISKPTSKNSE